VNNIYILKSIPRAAAGILGTETAERSAISSTPISITKVNDDASLDFTINRRGCNDECC